MFGVGDEIHFVADQHLIVTARHNQFVAAHDAENDDIEVGENFGQLPERRVDDRATILTAHRDDAQQAIAKGQHIEGAGHLKAPLDGARDFDLGRYDQVDGQMIRAVEIGPCRLQITLVAYAGDLFRHAEYRMRDLAGDHVDLVRIGHGDDHIGIFRARFVEHVGQRGAADQAADFGAFRQFLRDLRIIVDHGDVIRFARQLVRNAQAYLPGATDDYPHAAMLRSFIAGSISRPCALFHANDPYR